MSQLPSRAVLQLVLSSEGLNAPPCVSGLLAAAFDAGTSQDPGRSLTSVFKKSDKRTLLATAKWLLRSDIKARLSSRGAFWAQIQWLDALEAMLNGHCTAPEAFRFAAGFAVKKSSAQSRMALCHARQEAFREALKGKLGRPIAYDFSLYHDAGVLAEYLHRCCDVPAEYANGAAGRLLGVELDRARIFHERKSSDSLTRQELTYAARLARLSFRRKLKARKKPAMSSPHKFA